jgi:hypothetical protein
VRKRENECGKRKEWIEEAERVFLSSHVGEGDGDDLCIGETTVLQFLPEIHMAPCKLPYCISHPAESPGASNSASAKVCTRLDRLISLQDCFLSDKMCWNYFTFFYERIFFKRDEIILHSKVHYKSIL